jgi:hypothetical protein
MTDLHLRTTTYVSTYLKNWIRKVSAIAVVHRWCTSGEQVVHKWCTSGAQVVHRWCTGGTHNLQRKWGQDQPDKNARDRSTMTSMTPRPADPRPPTTTATPQQDNGIESHSLFISSTKRKFSPSTDLHSTVNSSRQRWRATQALPARLFLDEMNSDRMERDSKRMAKTINSLDLLSTVSLQLAPPS